MLSPNQNNDSGGAQNPPPKLASDHTRVPLRLMGGSLIVTVELPNQMTEDAWKQMLDILNALKPGYLPPNGLQSATAPILERAHG